VRKMGACGAPAESQVFGGVALRMPLAHEEAMEAADGGQVPRLRAVREPVLVQRVQVRLHHLRGDVVGVVQLFLAR